MKRFLWGSLLLGVLLLPVSVFGTSITIMDLVPNDGSGDNFGFFQQTNGRTISIEAGTPPDYFSGIDGVAPGSTVLGSSQVFFDTGTLTIHGTNHDLTAFNQGSLFVTSLTLPTNGATTFTAIVTAHFSIDVTVLDTNKTFTVNGNGTGTITYSLVNGLYFPNNVEFTSTATTPEPGTFGLIGTGLIGILGAARRRLRM